MKRACLIALLGGVVTGSSFAQPESGQGDPGGVDAPAHSTESAVEDSPTRRAELGLARIPAEPEPITPVEEGVLVPVAPGLTGGEDWLSGLAVGVTRVPVASLLPEGMVLRERTGTVWGVHEDLWVFLPNESDRRPGEGAMLIAPSGSRDRMTSMLSGQADGQAVVVSGQVLLYHKHNYLLVTAYRRPTLAEQGASVFKPDPDVAAAPDAGDRSVPDTRTPNPPPTEVEELIRDLEGSSQSGTRRDDAIRERLLAAERDLANESGRRTGGGGDPAFSPPLVQDGTYLAQRRARLVREGTGAWMLRFDGDTTKLGNGALTVIPGKVLMLMELRAGISPEVPMTVSGRVYTSEGKGYFLPTVFRLERRGDVNPIQ